MNPNYVRTIPELMAALDEAASIRRNPANDYSAGVRDAHAWTAAQLHRLLTGLPDMSVEAIPSGDPRLVEAMAAHRAFNIAEASATAPGASDWLRTSAIRRLREAAERMRQHADNANPGAWSVEPDDEVGGYEESDIWRVESDGQPHLLARRVSNHDAPHIAAWNPGVARLVARVLEVHASVLELDGGTPDFLDMDVLNVALVFLGIDEPEPDDRPVDRSTPMPGTAEAEDYA